MRKGGKEIAPVSCIAVLAIEAKKAPWPRCRSAVSIAPGQGQTLELEMQVAETNYKVSIVLPKGRWTKLPKTGTVGVENPATDLVVRAELERVEDALCSGRFRYSFGNKIPGGPNLGGRWVSGFDFYLELDSPVAP